jgi:hypothetical protein
MNSADGLDPQRFAEACGIQIDSAAAVLTARAEPIKKTRIRTT